jgi:hypothetical protein
MTRSNLAKEMMLSLNHARTAQKGHKMYHKKLKLCMLRLKADGATVVVERKDMFHQTVLRNRNQNQNGTLIK